ncbi:sterol glucosyltransferase [Phlyctema vagabunda]|uniref:Sterol glucosyltransferase n=1 Tax=Phlyctema vagabunda TaxID=108571 RepID=A0ABR4PW63_9HELO
MVRNPSIIPTFNTLVSGEIGRKRKMIYTMLNGCWESCIAPDAASTIPFVAGAIIADPPSFAHIHYTQALSVPLHLMFTMPWSPTRAFPHPLANMQSGQTDPQTVNYLSYGLVDIMTWQGLSDVINLWRRRALSLEAVPAMAGPGLAETLKVPFIYCWSPALIPKPRDRPSYIDIFGFFFRKENPYTPDKELADFLSAGPRPIYIGFGSIAMDDAAKMTDILQQTVKECDNGCSSMYRLSFTMVEQGQRHVVYGMDVQQQSSLSSASRSSLDSDSNMRTWGTNPRIQPFWANMVAAAGAGPRPISYKTLDSAKLTAAIRLCLAPETASAAKSIASRMRNETGVREAAQSFHRHLPVETLKCDLLEGQNASFTYGMYDRITGIVTQPMNGAKKDGALGFAKGLAKGFIGIITKPGAAMFGLVAYPAMGFYKSMHHNKLSPAQAQILHARQMLSAYTNEYMPVQDDEASQIILSFENQSLKNG